jgi:hypothetical protein
MYSLSRSKLQPGISADGEDPRGRDATQRLDAYCARLESRFPNGVAVAAGQASALEKFAGRNGCLLDRTVR